MLMLGGILVLLIIAVSFYIYHQPHRKRKRAAKAAPTHITESTPEVKTTPFCSTQHPYHCVTIIQGEPACQAVKEIDNTYYLSHEAPHIPLKECDIAQCNCHYQHKEDRRGTQENRRLEFGVTRELYGAFGEKNRRKLSRGRRKEDRGEE
ncbi:hypothetical protein [Shewanella woodyi]|uniref:hypothetical protein n=1 Tax=Shewanella woodyi TaxID=60961 RepID=UPI0007F8FCAA|nr:hypothetical protein [Shewanella woodyi]